MRERGRHAREFPDAEQERQPVAERQEVSEQAAQQEEARRRQHERNGEFTLPFVEPRRDERPNLVKNPRRAEE